MIKINTPSDSPDMQDIFASDGVISGFFEDFEARPQQIQMACAVQKALFKGRRLAVEAGTGVGKSFAYLVPAIESVAKTGEKLLVSTFTINLQEQLINKDLPFLAEALPWDFTAILAKGRGNYLCKRRLEFALKKKRSLFGQLSDELMDISKWSRNTQDGSLSDMPFVPSAKAWDAVNSEHGNCPGRRCAHFGECFYRRARRRLDAADIVVTNHALMFSDLALKDENFSLLPDYKNVIIDEAHNIEQVAQGQFGIDISSSKINYILDGLYNNKTRRGLLGYRKDSEKAMEFTTRIRKESRVFFKNARDWFEANRKENSGRCYKGFIDDNLSGYLKQLRTELSALTNKTEDVDEKFEMLRFVNRSAAMAKDIADFLSQEKDNYVYWVEAGSKKRARVRLKSAALNVGADLKRVLFDKHKSVVLTSATLSSDGKGAKTGFEFFAGRIGLEDFDAQKLGSPFDYQKQVTIYIEKDLPTPNDSSFVSQACGAIKKYILQTQARAFVLFTSYYMLDKFSEEISGWLRENDIELLQQGAGRDRSSLLKHFKKNQRSVLFGTDSFWQGVDVPGEALSNVIIVRLPFSVPDQPLLAGRIEQIKKQGGNAFMDYQLPSAIIKFKQGFGRLIRKKTDTGIVVVLDSRIVNKRYGPMFLAAVPKCTVEIVETRGD